MRNASTSDSKSQKLNTANFWLVSFPKGQVSGRGLSHLKTKFQDKKDFKKGSLLLCGWFPPAIFFANPQPLLWTFHTPLWSPSFFSWGRPRYWSLVRWQSFFPFFSPKYNFKVAEKPAPHSPAAQTKRECVNDEF